MKPSEAYQQAKREAQENNEKNHSAKVGSKVNGWTTEEKAQYEVFQNGNISRETIDKWIRNDLLACQAFISGVLSDESIFRGLADGYYARYEKLHKREEVVAAMENRGGVS